MSGAEIRTRIFEETMRVCCQEDSLRSAVDTAIAKQYILWQEDGEPMWSPRFERAAERKASLRRSFEAARTYAQAGQKVCVLNFASSVSPGGGVTRGSQAQEESLCRVSLLYAALSAPNAAPFYARHWEMIRAGTMKRDNRDDCIYTPNVVVVREDGGSEAFLPPSERYTVDVITCAAPDLRSVPDSSRYAPSQDELFAVLVKRWRRILAAAAAENVDVLILGAFGCGVFANPPQLVAKAFEQAARGIDHCFRVIEFAVYARDEYAPNYAAFANLALNAGRSACANTGNEIVFLPKDLWKGTPIPLVTRSDSYFDFEMDALTHEGCSISIVCKAAEQEIIHKPDEYDFPDRLYQDHWEKAEAYGMVGENGELLACIEVCPEEWSNRLMVTELWVAEALRGKGVGRRLMDKAKEVAVQQNRRAIILETQSCNTNAIGFYLHQGFELIGFDTCCYTNNDIGRREVRMNLGYFFHREGKRN